MKKIGLIAILSVLVCSIWAIPARKGRVVKVQPDGSQVVVYQHGDAYFRWMTNDDGEWLERGEDGYYRVSDTLTEEAIAAKRIARIAPKNDVATPLNIAPRGLVILVSFQDVAFLTSHAEMSNMLVGEDYARNYSYVNDDEEFVEKQAEIESYNAVSIYVNESFSRLYITADKKLLQNLDERG